MSEIKLTKAQERVMAQWAKVMPHTIYVPPVRQRVYDSLVGLGLAEPRLVDLDPHIPSIMPYRLTEAGLAYCKKHFTTTEQP